MVPLETLLVGAWLALAVATPAVLACVRHEISGDAAARLASAIERRTGFGEALIGIFVCLLALRRRARGAALVLPFAALAATLATPLFLAPLAASVAPARPTWVAAAAFGVAAAQALLLFATFGVARARGR